MSSSNHTEESDQDSEEGHGGEIHGAIGRFDLVREAGQGLPKEVMTLLPRQEG